jgi:hypothetical protein
MVLRSKTPKPDRHGKRTTRAVRCEDSRGMPELDRLEAQGERLVAASLTLLLEIHRIIAKSEAQ